jgi:putative DNA primase/helicase
LGSFKVKIDEQGTSGDWLSSEGTGMDQIEKFKKALVGQGLDPGKIFTDGAIHRFPTWGDNAGETSGAYWHNGNVGWFQDWRTMERAQVVKGTLSEADKAALADSFSRNGQKVSRKALEAGIQKIWNVATKPDGHPYLLKKQIQVVPQVKQFDGKLIIPLFGINSELNGLQRIDADGRKRFLAGSRKKGSFFSIVGGKTIVVCEGFATGVSIHQATGFSVAVAFDAGNLLPVAKKMCAKVGSDRVVVAGDNDNWKTATGQPDTGTRAAKKVASAIGVTVVLPVFQSPNGEHTTDFNDLFVAEGADAVKTQFKAAKTGEDDFDAVEPVDIFGDILLTGKP